MNEHGAVEKSRQTVAPLSPKQLPELLAKQICSLTRATPEQDLVARFGVPVERIESDGVVKLLWKTSDWMGVAKYSDNELQLAGVNVIDSGYDALSAALTDFDDAYKVGEATREEMERQLGRGVRTSVSWHHGLDIDARTARANNIPLRALEDHCNDRITFIKKATGKTMTLAFREGILDNHFDY